MNPPGLWPRRASHSERPALRLDTLSFDGHATGRGFHRHYSHRDRGSSPAVAISPVRGWFGRRRFKTLKTGNGKRDKDLNKSMESDKYPDIRFELTGITPQGRKLRQRLRNPAREAAHTWNDEASKPSRLQLLFNGSEARVRSGFPLSLKEYHIGGSEQNAGCAQDV